MSRYFLNLNLLSSTIQSERKQNLKKIQKIKKKRLIKSIKTNKRKILNKFVVKLGLKILK
ncbi:hypothetical protein DOY81_001934 [Sarcophaga bullata]|nr:hypothetical protein DOY81_001934 [Sarcophaga bullata]